MCIRVSRFAFLLSIVFLDELWIKLSLYLVVTVSRTSAFTSAKYHAIVPWFVSCIYLNTLPSPALFFFKTRNHEAEVKNYVPFWRRNCAYNAGFHHSFSFSLKSNLVVIFADILHAYVWFSPVTVRTKEFFCRIYYRQKAFWQKYSVLQFAILFERFTTRSNKLYCSQSFSPLS